MGRPMKPIEDEISIRCTCCDTKKKEGEFFLNKNSIVYKSYGKRISICKNCLQNIYEVNAAKYDEQTALKLCCAIMDIPYSIEVYASAMSGYNELNIGVYIRQMQMRHLKNKTFLNSLLDGSISKSSGSTKEVIESHWSDSDKQNMEYCVSTFGYDPFDNCGMSNNDRKYCFNILSTYCDIPGIKDDGHKMQACIQMCQCQLQVRKIDEKINDELDDIGSDDDKIKTLAATKKQLQSIIAQLAKDNNISSNYNDNSKRGKNTLSQKQKEMLSDGYEPVRPNLFNIKESASFRQIAEISLESMGKQLAFDDADCAEIIKNQRETNVKLKDKVDELEEANRNLKNELNYYKRGSRS